LEKFLCSDEHSASEQFVYHKNVLSPERYRAHLEGSDDEDIECKTLINDASKSSFQSLSQTEKRHKRKFIGPHDLNRMFHEEGVNEPYETMDDRTLNNTSSSGFI
jgi:hypothetical protein